MINLTESWEEGGILKYGKVLGCSLLAISWDHGEKIFKSEKLSNGTVPFNFG